MSTHRSRSERGFDVIRAADKRDVRKSGRGRSASSRLDDRSTDNERGVRTMDSTGEVRNAEGAERLRQESRQVPEMGWQAWWYRFARVLNPKVKPPRLSNKEVAHLARIKQQKLLECEVQYNIAMIRHLMALGVQPVLCFLNIKSGGKTTIALYVASAIAEYARKTVLLLPATQNTATSTAGVLSGITSGNLISVREFSRRVDEFGSYRAVSHHVPRTIHGVGVIVEDQNIIIGESIDFGANEFSALVKTTYPQVDVLVLDGGNDDINSDSIGLQAVRMSDVLNVVAMLPTPISVETARRTITGYNTDSYDGSPGGDQAMSGEKVATRTKMQRANLVATGVRSTDKFPDFEEWARPEQRASANPIPKWSGEGFAVPFDDYIGRETPSVADLSRISPCTHLAILKIAVANLEQAAHQQGIDTTVDAPEMQLTFDSDETVTSGEVRSEERSFS